MLPISFPSVNMGPRRLRITLMACVLFLLVYTALGLVFQSPVLVTVHILIQMIHIFTQM